MKNLPLAGFRPLLVLSLLIALFLGCRKDFDTRENPTLPIEQSSSTLPISIAEAQKWFEQSIKNRSFDSPTIPEDVYPLWYMAKESRFQNSKDIVIVPVAPKDSFVDVRPGDGIRLIVFKNANDEIDGCFTVFVSENSGGTFSGELSTSNFQGILFTVSLTGRPLSVIQVVNDTIFGGLTNPDSIFARIAPDPVSGEPDPETGCFDFGKGKFWNTVKGWFKTIGGWFADGGESGTGGHVIIFPGGFGQVVIGNAGTTNPTGGGGNTLSQYLQNAIFGDETIFSVPTQYPCRNEWYPQSGGASSGNSPIMPALLTAHPEGIGNFVQQWIQLMATGNYNSPTDAMNDIDWDEVGSSNTNDMMDGSPLNTVILQSVIAMLGQAKNQGCGYNISEAWNSINTGPVADLIELSQLLDLDIAEMTWLGNNALAAINTFLNAHPNNTTVLEIANTVIQYNLEFNTLDDLNYIYDNLEGIEEAVIPPTNPPVSLANPICAQILNFAIRTDEVSHLQYAGMILQNSYFQFNVPGSTPVQIQTYNVKFTADASVNTACLPSCPAFAANATNIAVLKTQQLIDSLPSGTLREDVIRTARFSLPSIINREFKNQVQNCNSDYTTDVVFQPGMFGNWNNLPIVDCDAQIVNCP